MTPPSPERFPRVGLGGCAGGEAGGWAVSGTWVARGSCSSSRAADPDDRRRLLRRAGPDARSGFALAAGGAATAGGSGIAVPFGRGRRLRRRGAPGTLDAAGSAAVECGCVAATLR